MFRSILCLLVVLPCVLLAPTQSYPNMKQLDTNYDLYWEANSTYIMFEVHVRAHGWVGFGLSEAGLMFPGDVIYAWVNHNKAEFEDMYTTGHAPPTKDASQDWTLYHSSESGADGTVLKFGRLLNTHDTNDLVIHPGKNNVIFAWSDVDPAGWDSITYHAANRGSAVIDLLAGGSAAVGR